MAVEFNLEGRGLTHEDEILARVVLDLGLAKPADVEGACDLVDRSKTAGSAKSLADVMQEMGALHPRFLSAVMKAVNSRLASRKRVPAARPGQARPESAQPSPPSPPSSPAPAPAAGAPQPQSAPPQAPLQAPAQPPVPQPPAAEPPAQASPKVLTPKGPEMKRRDVDLGNVQIPEAFLYKRAPKGEGFSVRSKTDVASAWAAHRRGEAPPKPKQPMAEARPEPKNPLAELVGPAGTEGQAPSRRAPVNPLERLLGSGAGPAREPPSRAAGQRNPLARSRSRAVEERAARNQEKKAFVPAKRRFAPSGVTQSIDVDDLRAELGIGPKPEPKAVPDDAKQKAIALQAFIKRIVRTTLHQQCLEIVLRQRLTVITASRLAAEAACREKEAKRVLEHWKSGGLVVMSGEEYGETQYNFSPARADLVTIRDFMTLWTNPDWHNKLLGWIIQEEGTR